MNLHIQPHPDALIVNILPCRLCHPLPCIHIHTLSFSPQPLMRKYLKDILLITIMVIQFAWVQTNF